MHQLDAPTGRTNWTSEMHQIKAPTGRTDWTHQLDGPDWAHQVDICLERTNR